MIRFVAADHSYWIGDQQLRGVTALIATITPAFDTEGISRRIAKRDGVSQKEILRQWKEKGDAGLLRGSRVHAYVEDVLGGTVDTITDALNVKMPEMIAFDAAWQAFTEKLGANIICREAIVGDAELGVAGRVDAVLGVGDLRHVFDWKTGRFERHNRFENLLPPFEDLSNCEFVRYSLQTSLYRLLLERGAPDTRYGDGYLVHLDSGGGHWTFRSTDYRERLMKWLRP